MAVTLLSLDNGHRSLEYQRADVPLVKTAIRELFSEPKLVEQYAVCSTVQIEGIDFIYQDEWDDLCLISQSATGDAILTAIAERLKAPLNG